MEEQIDAFIEDLDKRQRYAPNTLLAYRNDLIQLLQFIRVERPHMSSWSRVDGLLVQAFLLQMKSRALSPATIARKIAAYKSFFFYLFESRLVVSNPTAGIETPPVPKLPPPAMSPEQVETLLESASDDSPTGMRDRAMLELLYAAGLRVSELVSLPLEALDLEAGMLRVVGPNKSREIGIRPRALEALRVYLGQGRPSIAADDSGPLFVNSRGARLTRQGIWLILNNYVRRAGIEGEVTPRSLRHAFAAHRLAQGERVQDLQHLLGHAHLSTTMSYGRPQGEPAHS